MKPLKELLWSLNRSVSLLLVLSAFVSASLVVNSKIGTFIGNSSIPGLEQFLGIPYAEPPIGPLRFASPQPLAETPSEPFVAAKYGPGCLQDPAFALYNGLDEDFLSLNIVRPSGTVADSKLPILFWIHGGGNANGQSIYYNGTAIVQFSIAIQQPIIYVFINYRLGGFGFLNSPDFAKAGLLNNGLKDQYLALQWVSQNINNFGGDPDKVTILGESAGAWDCQAQLHYAYVKNETNKYFRGLITQSGSAGSLAGPHAYLPEDGSVDFQRVLGGTNCTTASDSIACLRDADISALSPLLTAGSVYQYALDGQWFNDNLTALLTDDYQFAKIPIIHGANLDEGSVFIPSMFPDSSIPSRDDLVTYVSSFVNDPTSVRLASDVVDAYLYNTSLADLGQNFDSDTSVTVTYWPAVAVYSDAYMHLGRRAFLKAAVRQNVPAWGFYFRQTPPLSQLNLTYEYPGVNTSYAQRVGVQHGAELAYAFGEASNLDDHTDGDVAVSTTIMRAWIGFAHNLDPNVEGVQYWPKYNDGKANRTQLGTHGEQGLVLYLAEQGSEVIHAGSDNVRVGVYEAWNNVMELLKPGRIY